MLSTRTATPIQCTKTHAHTHSLGVSRFESLFVRVAHNIARVPVRSRIHLTSAAFLCYIAIKYQQLQQLRTKYKIASDPQRAESRDKGTTRQRQWRTENTYGTNMNGIFVFSAKCASVQQRVRFERTNSPWTPQTYEQRQQCFVVAYCLSIHDSQSAQREMERDSDRVNVEICLLLWLVNIIAGSWDTAMSVCQCVRLWLCVCARIGVGALDTLKQQYQFVFFFVLRAFECESHRIEYDDCL